MWARRWGRWRWASPLGRSSRPISHCKNQLCLLCIIYDGGRLAALVGQAVGQAVAVVGHQPSAQELSCRTPVLLLRLNPQHTIWLFPRW